MLLLVLWRLVRQARQVKRKRRGRPWMCDRAWRDGKLSNGPRDLRAKPRSFERTAGRGLRGGPFVRHDCPEKLRLAVLEGLPQQCFAFGANFFERAIRPSVFDDGTGLDALDADRECELCDQRRRLLEQPGGPERRREREAPFRDVES